MFGKKKEEDWEFIGTENYFQKDNYGKVADDESRHKERTGTDYLIELFKPYLMLGEQILCVIGGGKGKTEGILENGKTQRKLIHLGTFFKVIIAVFVISVLAGIFLHSKIAAMFAALSMFIYSCGFLPIILIVIVVALIWGLNFGFKSVNYAITDKRIIIYSHDAIQSIHYGDVTAVDSKTTSGNTGKVIVRTVTYENGVKCYGIYPIPNVKEPLRIRYIIVNAVEKYQADPMNEKNLSSDGSQRVYAPQTPRKLHNEDVQMTMYDKKIRTPYNSRSSDNMND